MGFSTFLKKLEIIAFSDFFKAIKKPLERKKIGYAGKTKADILKYFFPNSITVGSLENRLVIIFADVKTITPEIIIIIKEYFIAVK